MTIRVIACTPSTLFRIVGGFCLLSGDPARSPRGVEQVFHSDSGGNNDEVGGGRGGIYNFNIFQ